MALMVSGVCVSAHMTALANGYDVSYSMMPSLLVLIGRYCGRAYTVFVPLYAAPAPATVTDPPTTISLGVSVVAVT